MLQTIWCIVSGIQILDQTPSNKVFTLVRHILKCWMIKMELSFYHIFNDLLFASTWEWHFSWEHDILNNTHWPNINLGIVFLQEYLWSNIVWRATHCMHCLVLWKVLGKTKINHFNACKVVLSIKHKILWFDIPMRDVSGMKIFKCLEKLLHYKGRNLFRQVLLLNDVVE